MPPRRGFISPDTEKLIQEACTQLRAEAKPNISDVIRKIEARTGVALPYHTVRNRFQGKKHGHVSQQLLSPEAEKVLVDWVTFLSDTNHPVSEWTVRQKAEVLCGKTPSKTWMVSFLRRHPEVKLGKSSGLDRVPSSCPAGIQAVDGESDDQSSSSGVNDVNNGGENSRTKTAILPGDSQAFSAPVLSHHPPLAPRSVVPNSTTFPVNAFPMVLVPFPPSVFYASSTQPNQKRVAGRPTSPSNPVQAQLDTLSQTCSDLSQQYMELRSENLALKARCAIAETETRDLKRRLNTKKNKPQKRRKLNVKGLGLAKEREALRMAEEQKKREARAQRVARRAEREEQGRQRDPNAPFPGALTSKTKADLQDIAQILGLTTDGQKKDILTRINAHFDANPLLYGGFTL